MVIVSEKHGLNVGMMMCFYCTTEAHSIIMPGKLPGDAKLPKEQVYDMEPCHACAKLMEAGVLLINVKDGEMAKVTEKHRQYDLEVDRLPRNNRNKVLPFIPNPYRTGEQCVVRRDAIKRMISDSDTVDRIIEIGWLFVEDKDWDYRQFPRTTGFTTAQLVKHWTKEYNTNMAVLDLVTCDKEVSNEAIELIKFRDYPSLEEFANRGSAGIVYFQSDGGYTRCNISQVSGTLQLIETSESADREEAWNSPKAKSARIALELLAKTVMETWEKNPNLFGSELDSEPSSGDDVENTSSHTSCSEKNDDDRDTDDTDN